VARNIKCLAPAPKGEAPVSAPCRGLIRDQTCWASWKAGEDILAAMSLDFGRPNDADDLLMQDEVKSEFGGEMMERK
jgi:hypothetical protein